MTAWRWAQALWQLCASVDTSGQRIAAAARRDRARLERV